MNQVLRAKGSISAAAVDYSNKTGFRAPCGQLFKIAIQNGSVKPLETQIMRLEKIIKHGTHRALMLFGFMHTSPWHLRNTALVVDRPFLLVPVDMVRFTPDNRHSNWRGGNMYNVDVTVMIRWHLSEYTVVQERWIDYEKEREGWARVIKTLKGRIPKNNEPVTDAPPEVTEQQSTRWDYMQMLCALASTELSSDAAVSLKLGLEQQMEFLNA